MSDEYYKLMGDALLSLMIIEEKHEIYPARIHMLKDMYNVDKTLGLKTVKSTMDLVCKLGFINEDDTDNYNYKCSIRPEIHMIKSYKSLKYMDENNVTLKHLLRAEKLKQVKKKYETT